jgi:hypothetical protein
MASEKVIYWTVLGVLALASVNGLVTERRGWAARLADRSTAIAEQASSELAASYANLTPDRENDDLQRLVRDQVRLVRVQSTMARDQADMVRVQVRGIRARVMQHRVHAVIDCPPQNLVIDLPQPPQVFDDSRF